MSEKSKVSETIKCQAIYKKEGKPTESYLLNFLYGRVKQKLIKAVTHQGEGTGWRGENGSRTL